MRIYLAGPWYTGAEIAWNNQLAGAFRQRCTADILLPQSFCRDITDPKLAMAKCIIELKSSDVVVVNADGADVDSGTAFEAGVACTLGVEVVVYCTDFRQECSVMLVYAGTFLPCQGDTPDTVASKILREIDY